MSSLIPGYEYDIFISYRQKDNKYDGWVTEFEGNLRKELEAAFKEDISVYFDINPHDGLLETHDVDASLKVKLKCLIFIPVISRTYCDPKSFAWEHEFKAFMEMASNDRFGLKIKVPNGNVASRVLPVRIYDLDIEDIRLCESLLEGPIRGVDFIYKESGINRPLTPEDNETRNLENTKYRNQINKTGNAIKEIISGLKSEPAYLPGDKTLLHDPAMKEGSPNKKDVKVSKKTFDHKTVRRSLVFIITAFIIITILSFLIFINRQPSGKRIAILFSTDITSDTSFRYVGDIYAETIHSKIKAIKRITVKPRINMLQYRESEKPLANIRQELSADYLLYGNIERDNNDIKLWFTLISEKHDKELWSKEYQWDRNMISNNSTEIVHKVADYLKSGLSSEELNTIESDPSANAEATLNYTIANAISYNAWSSYAMGNRLLESVSFSSAISSYDKAIENDSLFAEAYAKRAIARSWGYYTGQLDSTHIEKCGADINKALEINKELPDAQIAMGFYYYYCEKNSLKNALYHFRIASEKSPGDYQPLFYMAMVYRKMGEWAKSQNLIRKVLVLDPQEALYLTNIGTSYTYLHNYDSALIFYQKAIDIMPAWPDSYNNMIVVLLLRSGNTREARSILDKALTNTKDNFSEIKIQLLIYEKKFAEALKETEISPFSEFRYKGDKYLFIAMINRYLNKQLEAGINFDSALVSYEKDLQTDSINPLLHSLAGIAYAGKGLREKALQEADKTRDLFKDNIGNEGLELINLAYIFTMTGEYDKAISTIEYLLKTPSLFSVKMLQLDHAWKPLMELQAFQKLIVKYS
ncbi:MAG: hypothetical protein A2X05_10705 [Bacteroidetes bacterium GWE2_41_25]|nr:MAG: hypothetical protein A2X03_07795 [Bacteroidetes bacterium GWA2_40_15]OFX94122.1 MAG: hypothetical protein A2X05_10705 [Bacteroidetes bacterium GWE2_41_25]OFX99778.1 MAG: hypothetical protein A2X06_11465 [Bacteroidetes bacterium GWC2_40_22]OFY61471.1 MAG: hypothetical protein A2X04_12870 [Bacteroidetes bacterium GWF2_41_9]HAM11653.1 hypothetical protein [Bacteroidales bacterium]